MFTVTMKLARETKNTFRFEAEDENLDVLYIQKGAFSGTTPSGIEVTVQEK
jgi:hypothetical protein